MEQRFYDKLREKMERGVGLVDALVAIAIVSIAFSALLEVGVVSIKMSDSLEKKTTALSLAKDGIEGVRSFRDGTTWNDPNGIGSKSTGPDFIYRLAVNLGAWELQAGSEIIGIFTRKIIFDDVSRDANGNIIEKQPNPPYDPDARKVTVIVEWENTSLQLVAYLTNWK